MINTHGLPIKFTFHVSSRASRTYLVDFTDVKNGCPILQDIDEKFSTYEWSLAQIERHVANGTWVIDDIFEEIVYQSVEDLL